jgi:hypothetical protein
MQVIWTGLERTTWDALHRTAAAALQQDWAYGDAMQALGTRCLRAAVIHDERLVGIAQFLLRRIGGMATLALCSHGPVWSADLSVTDREAGCRVLKRSAPVRWPRAILLTPDAVSAESAGVRRLIRVMTGHATVRIDLAQETAALRAAMHGKWRNRLAAAERSRLKVEKVGGKPAQYRWLLDRELAQRSEKRYIALPDGFVEAWQVACGQAGRDGRDGRTDAMLTLRADLGRDAVAGMLFLIHGEAATYQVGWVGDAGRDLGAHNLLLWHGMQMLKAQGIRMLDLGGVDTARGAGIARFKIGSGGEVMMLAGTYL